MNHRDINDWRNVAHDEYETRKNAELQLSHATDALNTLKQTLVTSNNYNTMLEQKLAEVEEKFAEQTNKLQVSIQLLKNAKLLFDKRKDQINNLETANETLQFEISQRENEINKLQLENTKLNEQLAQQSMQLESEALRHAKTNDKLEQALARIKLMTTGTMSDMKILPSPPNRPGRITSPDVIYAEAGAEFGNKSTMININNSKKSQSLPARVLKKLMSRFSYD